MERLRRTIKDKRHLEIDCRTKSSEMLVPLQPEVKIYLARLSFSVFIALCFISFHRGVKYLNSLINFTSTLLIAQHNEAQQFPYVNMTMIFSLLISVMTTKYFCIQTSFYYFQSSSCFVSELGPQFIFYVTVRSGKNESYLYDASRQQ